MQKEQEVSAVEQFNGEGCEVIDVFGVEELEQRYEYDTNITICHYEWH